MQSPSSENVEKGECPKALANDHSDGVHNGNGNQASTSSPIKSDPPHHFNLATEQRPTSPIVRINLGGKISPEDSNANVGKPCIVGANGRGKKQRKWRSHQGRNRFFFDGRLIMARQGSIFLLTLFMIIFTFALFSFFDLPYLTQKVSIVIPIASCALLLLVLSSLLRTALSDPGIVPRASPREVLEWERQCQESDPFFQRDEWAQPRTRVVNIRGQPIKLKYCFTCCIFRPPRSSHCSICDNCVLNFDHHCPWLGNCIGLRNYRHFYVFITSLSLLDAFMGFCVGLHLYLVSQEKGTFLEAIKESPPSMLTGLINVISIWSVLGLSGFHTYLLALGQTTNEDIKGTFNRKLHPHVKNPYSTGNCIKNILLAICTPEQPSLLDRRGWLPPEEGPTIFVDSGLLNKLHANRRIHVQNYLSLLNQRAENNRSAPSLVNVDGERKKMALGKHESKNGISSCPSSPPLQRRSNSSRMRELFRQSEGGRKVVVPSSSSQSAIGKPTFSSTNSLDRSHQHKTRICHSNNLIAPIENLPGPTKMTAERHSSKEKKPMRLKNHQQQAEDGGKDVETSSE